MESLYRKYRPQTFDDVVGQQHVVSTLEHAVLGGRTSHAYLFCGPRGTGKTTMARLLAKALLCEQGAGHLPDGTCAQCSLIAAGEHPDVYELDAASRTGVDNVREEIINRVSYAPVQGAFKMYIIDEVHMLTPAAFNALLKTLEEPPAHVVFVLCTTDPQKIPATILSRVQRFDFRPIGSDDIRRHLAYVCEQEGFTYEDGALDLVVRHARGGMRDALSTLEQLSVFGSGVIGLDATRDLLGAVSGAALDAVVQALASRDVPQLFTHVGELVDSGRDLLQFTRELAAHMRDVYVAAAVGTNPSVLPAGADAQVLAAEAAAFGSTDRLARILTLLGEVSTQMSTAPNQRLALEIAFTRMARPKEDLTLASLAERIAELERGMAGAQVTPLAAPSVPTAPTAHEDVTKPTGSGPAPAPAAQAAAPTPAAEAGAAPMAPKAQSPAPPARTAAEAPVPAAVPSSVPNQPAPVVQPAPAAQPAPTAKPAPARQQAAQPASGSALDPSALQRTWRQAASTLLERIPPRGSLLANALPVSDDGQKLVVGLPKGSGFALKMLERADVRKDVENIVFEFFGNRDLRFVEGLPSDLQLPQAARADATAQPAPRPQPAPNQQVTRPAPVQHVPAQPQPQPDYPMPWDEPAQAPAPDPSYDYVPYEELDVAPVAAYDAPPMSAPPSALPSVPPVTATQDAPRQEAPAAQAAPAQPSAPAPKSAPGPATTAAAAPAQPAPASAPEPAPEPFPEAPADLPPELSAILENAFEVFGEGIQVRK